MAAVCSAPGLASQPAAIDDALHSLYNFDFTAAHATLNSYISAHPQDPLPYAFRGSAYLFYELDRLGVLESEFLTDDDRLVEKALRGPTRRFASSCRLWTMRKSAPRRC